MDFIGVGAQKAGTSWIYACLYEHPELCMPFKEIHFFSRERYTTQGIPWYEDRFKTCGTNVLRGEYSTSYMYTKEAAERIKKHYPDAKIIMSLRNPIDRAYSHYINAIKSGEAEKDATFEDFCNAREDVLGQGMYYEQVKRYFDVFGRDQVLVLIYEDIAIDQYAFIQSIYRFLGVDDSFVPSMLERKVNIARRPRLRWIDQGIIDVAQWFRNARLDKFVWIIKKSGLPDLIRSINTKAGDTSAKALTDVKKNELRTVFAEDVHQLSTLLAIDLEKKWFL